MSGRSAQEGGIYLVPKCTRRDPAADAKLEISMATVGDRKVHLHVGLAHIWSTYWYRLYLYAMRLTAKHLVTHAGDDAVNRGSNPTPSRTTTAPLLHGTVPEDLSREIVRERARILHQVQPHRQVLSSGIAVAALSNRTEPSSRN